MFYWPEKMTHHPMIRCCKQNQSKMQAFKTEQKITDKNNEVYSLARHSPRADANIIKACNTMQWSHKIS